MVTPVWVFSHAFNLTMLFLCLWYVYLLQNIVKFLTLIVSFIVMIMTLIYEALVILCKKLLKKKNINFRIIFSNIFSISTFLFYTYTQSYIYHQTSHTHIFVYFSSKPTLFISATPTLQIVCLVLKSCYSYSMSHFITCSCLS